MSHSTGTVERIVGMELLLVAPAMLFMAALVVRYFEPGAQQIVMWYAVRPWTLWLLLIALPVAVFVIGCLTLARGVRRDAATVVGGVATLVAAIDLVVVGIHMLTN
jgi:hypothetical protein